LLWRRNPHGAAAGGALPDPAGNPGELRRRPERRGRHRGQPRVDHPDDLRGPPQGRLHEGQPRGPVPGPPRPHLARPGTHAAAGAQADRTELAPGLLPAAGWVRRALSNWAQPGPWSRHNLGYWTGGDYLGFGAGAHAHRNGRRSWNLSSPRTYIARSPAVEEG